MCFRKKPGSLGRSQCWVEGSYRPWGFWGVLYNTLGSQLLFCAFGTGWAWLPGRGQKACTCVIQEVLVTAPAWGQPACSQSQVGSLGSELMCWGKSCWPGRDPVGLCTWWWWCVSSDSACPMSAQAFPAFWTLNSAPLASLSFWDVKNNLQDIVEVFHLYQTESRF